MDDVKRPYDASGRQAQARARRSRVVSAAAALFERDGYRATTVAAVAAEAEVSPEMVYKAFGSKAALAKAAFDVALAGDDQPTPIRERPAMTAIRAEPELRRKIEMFVDGLVLRLERSARIQIMVRDGRHVDESLQQIWDQLQHEGLTGMRLLAQQLLDTGQVRSDTTLEEVTDVLWNYLAIDHYERLVMLRGWPLERYRTWLTRAVTEALRA
jgi:AcrR family transcriptional regulator